MNQKGFTLIEIMVSIAIISILSAIAIPSYQSYIQKAAIIDVLHSLSPFKTAVELCSFEVSKFTGCDNGKEAIPKAITSRYLDKLTVTNGVMTLIGKKTLVELKIKITPTQELDTGLTKWAVVCESANNALKQRCIELIKL